MKRKFMRQTFVIEQDRIISILAAMQPICAKRTTLDATSYILCQVGPLELVLKSTDLEISLQSSCEIKESSLDQHISFLVSGKRLFDLAKELEGEITFSVESSQLELKAGSVEVALNIKNAQEFPPFPERIENLMQLNAHEMVDLLNKVAFVIPQNNTNPALNGLLLEISPEGLTMTATDGHCLAHVHTKQYMLEKAHKWLLPRRAVFEIKKLFENCKAEYAENTSRGTIFLGTCNNQLVFSGETFNFFTKLLATEFPECKAILDKTGFRCASVEKNQLVRALRRSACLLSGQFIATNFDFSQENIRISMHNTEAGKLQEVLPIAHFEGDSLGIRFYAPYVLNGLQAFSDGMITFYIKGSTKPLVFHTELPERHITYLVMPVSPSNK